MRIQDGPFPAGLLLIDKPVGTRSADCVAGVKRLLRRLCPACPPRVGHAGTLDSTASGLLILLVGAATRCSDYVMRLPKVYEAGIRLGFSTDTCDASGQPVFRGDAAKVDGAAFDRILCSFLGTRMQVPPGISALKVNGKVSHRTVRAGGESGLRARAVCVTSLSRRSALEDGRATISVTCGKGTYIRALARDIGALLGCGGHVESLRRVSVGPFDVADAQAPGDPDLDRLRPLREAGIPFQRVSLTAGSERRLTEGLTVPLSEAGRYLPGTIELRHGLCVEGEKLFGFAELEPSGGLGALLRPRTNIVSPA